MKPSTLRNTLFALCIAIAAALLYLVSWNTAGAQTPTPTPAADIWCITPTPTGDEWCMSAPVAATTTPTATVMPPPFVPTMTATPTVTPTVMPTPTATQVAPSPLPACVVEKCVWMPIGATP